MNYVAQQEGRTMDRPVSRPVIAVTMGDPSGVGPEIVIKALANKEITDIAKCVVIGDSGVIGNAMTFPGIPKLKINIIDDPEDGRYQSGVIDIIDLRNVDLESFSVGEIRGEYGRAAYDYIEKSVELALSRKAAAVATTPINKEALRLGDVNYIGHTEIYGALTGTDDPLTMFEVRGMRVFFLTRHISLKQACEQINKDRIINCVVRCFEALSRLGIESGTMAIAGLNPHSGEHGLFGTEEIDEIVPAVQELKDMGYNVEGPVGADSVFHLALQGRYNSVLSLYHDQGHIATKTLDFERTIAITNGMPILRTSVDHGTAMDIAGSGMASSVSMEEAIILAAKYEKYFNR